ncbi:hypothetical protein BVRB_6g139730 [Beta vulgaris subsp. vulgaris]|nr:hypothetical protein BVRB_6g139730 [Beta vulgaris subsp. vulgaris]
MPDVGGEVGFKPFNDATTGLYFISEEGSNCFDCSDFGWGENVPNTPEISSFFATALNGGDVLDDGFATKKLKSTYIRRYCTC